MARNPGDDSLERNGQDACCLPAHLQLPLEDIVELFRGGGPCVQPEVEADRVQPWSAVQPRRGGGISDAVVIRRTRRRDACAGTRARSTREL